jgi:hypothetical protein
MSDQVQLPDAAFDHARLHLAPPNGLQGGAYFAMLYYKDAPLYIQTPKCTSRQAVVPGKRPYIDLMFGSNDVSFLEWLEALEADAVRLIYEKRNMWISADLEKSDIEAGFTSPVRPYKGGKHYLIRAHIQPAKTQSCSCSVFDENERPVSVDHIKAEHQMYAVLEIQGIKFTSRSFQLEVALKQVLLVSNVPIFQSCVIRKPNTTAIASSAIASSAIASSAIASSAIASSAIDSSAIASSAIDSSAITSSAIASSASAIDSSATDSYAIDSSATDSSTSDSSTSASFASAIASSAIASSAIDSSTSASFASAIASSDSSDSSDSSVVRDSNVDASSFQLQEINLDVLEELEHMHLKLKKPTEVYYNMYRNAKQKAKELKKNAIAAYLEAKQIKSAHMLEDSDSDDSDGNSEFM